MTRRVLITGVSSGIGLAQARLFLEKGYQVCGVDQGENPLLEGDFHFGQLHKLESHSLKRGELELGQSLNSLP